MKWRNGGLLALYRQLQTNGHESWVLDSFSRKQCSPFFFVFEDESRESASANEAKTATASVIFIAVSVSHPIPSHYSCDFVSCLGFSARSLSLKSRRFLEVYFLSAPTVSIPSIKQLTQAPPQVPALNTRQARSLGSSALRTTTK